MTNDNLDDLDALRRILDALNGFDTNDQQRILRWAQEKLGLSAAPRVATAATGSSEATDELDGGERSRPANTTNIKSFVEAKNPSSENQFAAVVAYFYRFEAPEHMRKETITKDDLLDACRQAGRNRMLRPDQVLVNAHGQGLLDRAEKGAYAINTVGENLVAVALPSDGGGRARRAAPKKKSAAKSTPVRKTAAKATRGRKKPS